MTIADTDVLIDYLAERGAAAALIATELERGSLQTTVVTRFELLAGARLPRQRENLRRFLDAIPTLPLDVAAADRAAKVRRDLEGHGKAIGMGDSLIAGIALQHGATLMTRNRRHFERVEGLRVSAPE
jgi:tRNA(fMet)-specific endonuclease VapC